MTNATAPVLIAGGGIVGLTTALYLHQAGIWDAEAVTHALVQHMEPVQALQAYQAERLESVNQLVLSNRQAGPERVMQMAEEKCPGDCHVPCTCVRREVLEEVAANYKRLAGFDVAQVKSILG